MRSPVDTSEMVEWWLSHQSHRLCQLRRYQLITRSGISDTMTEYSSPENQSILSPCRLHTTRLMGASGPLLRKITHRLGPGSALESLALLSSGVYFNLDDVGESARHQLLQKTEFSTQKNVFVNGLLWRRGAGEVTNPSLQEYSPSRVNSTSCPQGVFLIFLMCFNLMRTWKTLQVVHLK